MIRINKNTLLRWVKQLDESKKVTIPQFVADWIEYCKNTFLSLARALVVFEDDFYNYANQKDHLDLLSFLGSMVNQEKFAKAWLFGYEAEKEKRYRVKMKGVNASYCVLTHYEDSNRWIMGTITNNHISNKLHTKKELEEAGFGWVFDCEGIEIEEVEDDSN